MVWELELNHVLVCGDEGSSELPYDVAILISFRSVHWSCEAYVRVEKGAESFEGPHAHPYTSSLIGGGGPASVCKLFDEIGYGA